MMILGSPMDTRLKFTDHVQQQSMASISSSEALMKKDRFYQILVHSPLKFLKNFSRLAKYIIVF